MGFHAFYERNDSMRKLSTWFLSLMLVAALVFGAVAVMAADAPALPTANVSEIENEEFLAQLETYLTEASFISFDTVVETMYNTGRDLHSGYRETSSSGLAKFYNIK